MNDLAFYSVLQMSPSRDRYEIVTVGLVIFWRGKWEVRVLPDPTKLRALNPAFPGYGLVNISKTLDRVLTGCESFVDAKNRLNSLGNDPTVQDFVGQFSASNPKEYESEIVWLMNDLVFPPQIKTHRIEKKGTSRLRTRLRTQFKKMRLLSADIDHIVDHKIIERFPISAERGLYAEFALKNGAMHITETVDFNVQKSSTRAKALEAQAKTFILSAAKDEFGPTTNRYVVIAGSNQNAAKPNVNLLSDYAEVFAVESSVDMNRYFDKIDAAARCI